MTKITARVIIEMLGAPKEYIEKTLKDYIEKLKKDGIKIIKETIEPAQKQNELFSTFVELDIEFDKMEDLLGFCFDSI
jgi:inactivated superfamily I helicase